MSGPASDLRIVRLEAENVKRLVAVAIEPDGSLVIVGGKNGAGKSSALDSIAYALGGKDLVCEVPLRTGAERGHVEVDLGAIVVRREFTAAGTSRLTVTSREGARFPSPQAMLDRLVGPLSFDPLAFTRMKPADQVETLRGLVGIDFAAIDAQRAALYETRTVAGREAKRLDGALRTMPAHPDAPAEEVSVADLMAELERSQEAHRAVEAAERGVHDLLAEAEGLAAREQLAAAESEKLHQEARDFEAKARSAAAERALVLARAERERGEVEAQRRGLPDLAPVRERIASADALNRAVRENREHAKLQTEARDALAKVERLSGEIAAIDEGKAAQLAAAKFPVEGLSFDASRVLLRGLPFDQASSAEQIRVSMAMAFAANPRLKIALIRDASLLDEESLALVAQMAAEADAQVWLERVGDGAECSVVIEDGTVRVSADLPREPSGDPREAEGFVHAGKAAAEIVDEMLKSEPHDEGAGNPFASTPAELAGQQTDRTTGAPEPVPITRAMREHLVGVLRARGKTTPADALRFLGVVLGRQVRSTEGLLVHEYESVLRGLGETIPVQAVQGEML